MKLELTPRELLALYSTLNYLEGDRPQDDGKLTDDQVLSVLYERVKSLILSSMSKQTSTMDQFARWSAKQQEKLEELKNEVQVQPTEVSELTILTDDDDEILDQASYPKRNRAWRRRKK